MYLDQRLADRKAETEAAELVGDARISLFERIEYLRQKLRLDSDTVVADSDRDTAMWPTVGGIGRDDRDVSPCGGKLDGVLDKIPDDLMQTCRIGAYDTVGGVELQIENDALLLDIGAADLDDMT